jgi:hypothetical protein
VKKIIHLKYQLFIIAISIGFWIYLLGPNFINPKNVEWLYSGDLSIYQIGWNFFKNDVWRFPLGSNPNYGIYYQGSIVFSDSIPLLAIFFKIFNKFLPNSFQYFSLWILASIYLQLFFSFKIIYKLSNNLVFSLISCLFFCISTIFLNRSGIHLALTGQWIILLAFYIELHQNKNKIWYRNLNILLSVLIHFYFTIILVLFYIFQKIYNLLNKEEKIKIFCIELFITFISMISLMYIVGYFTINLDDGLGWGYGFYNFNLNSFFNPLGGNNFGSFNWSFFFPIQQFQNSEHEGFSYLGISGIIFLFLFILNLFYKKYFIFYSNQKLLFICTLFIILAASNEINFGKNNILSIQLNDYIYLMLSSIRASGRLIWPVYYLIFITGIIFIFKNFKKKNSCLIIFILLLLQVIDLYPGLTNYKFGSQYLSISQDDKIKDDAWINLSNNFDEIRLVEPKNYSNIFNKMSKYLLRENFKKTDVTYLARVNRKSLAQEKYKLIKYFNEKNLEIFNKIIFVSDNIHHVRNIYYLYGQNLHYYFIDNLWLISAKEIKTKNSYKKKRLPKYYEIDLNEGNVIDFRKKYKHATGLGWNNLNVKTGSNMEGYFSTILFKVKGENCQTKSSITLEIEKYYKDLLIPIELTLILNKNQKEDFTLNNNNQFVFKFNCKLNDINTIDIKVKNPQSLFDLKKGLNRVKNSIILNSISING